MERQHLTLGALSEMNSVSQTGGQATVAERGTRENPYLLAEIDPLIDVSRQKRWRNTQLFTYAISERTEIVTMSFYDKLFYK